MISRAVSRNTSYRETARFFLRLLLFSITSLFLTACSNLFYQPDRRVHYSPEKMGVSPPREVTFLSEGYKLSAWFFKAKGPVVKGTLIQFHGNGENMTSHYLLAAWMADEGYNVITFDYRGYGKSEGIPTQENVHKDGVAALNMAWELYEKEGGGKFIVLGQSLGGAVSLRALEDFEHHPKVSLLILDSTFTDYRRVARRVLGRSWLTWLFSPLAYVLVSNEYGSDETLDKIKVPILLIHDKLDPVVPFSCAQGIYQKIKGKNLVQFWMLEYESHAGAFYSPKLPYRKMLLDLL